MFNHRFSYWLAALVLCVSLLGVTTTAQAKRHTHAATVYSAWTWRPKTKVKVKKGTLYTSIRLTKKKANLAKAKYRKLTYITGKQYAVKKANGKHARYNYIRSTNGKVKGYVWSGYVHQLKRKATTKKRSTKVTKTRKAGNSTPKSSEPATPVLSTAAYRSAFLQALNNERAKRNIPAVTESATYDTIAQHRSTQLLTNFAHGDDQSDFIADDLFTAAGVAGLRGECISMDYMDDADANPSASVAKRDIHEYIYNDADSNWGHRDILLDAANTTIGIGATQKPSSEYVYGAIDMGSN
ncbi:CAP domain-containing protein [Levilactobacillus namurensis]|uniref:CAP domain-containing protein n=1 Tax=Levilactobacillus namurensis TaxID=380393 RepID=UPI002231BED9|nr:CAP domain-containing protein [Levilactobacillus namurensis]MCW3777323.1 CAP domain-containing protein [Levilactobacillus namurensis]